MRVLTSTALATTAATFIAVSLASRCCDARAIPLRFSFKAATPATKSGGEVTCKGIGNPWTALTNACLCEPCDLCEFSFTAGKCRLITPHVESESDGADEPVQQPELVPEKWFLSEEEMTASRGGVTREGLRLWSAHNNVAAFAGTNEFFDAVYDDLEATTKKDHVWMTGWSFDDVVLRPQLALDKQNDTKLVAVLQRLANKGVDWHVLGWTNFFEASQNAAFQKRVNAIQPGPSKGGAYFLFDDRLPDATASHHQKTIAIKRPQGIVAYVGGVDLTWDRWDTIAHDVSDVRTRAGIERDGKTHGWMDCHMRVDGPAASDVAHNFLQRWNMRRNPLEDLFDPLFPFENPDYASLPALNTGEPLVENRAGTHAVQIVRTYSCDYEHYDEFAPRGEVSIFHSRLKAIKMAKNYVYIEDQYFTHVPQLVDALLEVLPQLQRVIIVTPPPSSDTSKTGYKKYQWQMITSLTDKYPNKVKVFQTKPERGIYIHSKLVIVDDAFASISSSNWNRRSMTTDTEIGANVVDSAHVDTPDGVQAGRVVRDYRVRKFVELTGKSYEHLNAMTLLASLHALDEAAEDPKSILATSTPQEDASFAIFTDDVQEIADPLVLCTTTT